MVEWSSCGIVKLLNGGMVQLWRSRIVEWWNGGVVESSDGGILQWCSCRIVKSSNGGVVELRSCRIVKSETGGMVEFSEFVFFSLVYVLCICLFVHFRSPVAIFNLYCHLYDAGSVGISNPSFSKTPITGSLASSCIGMSLPFFLQ